MENDEIHRLDLVGFDERTETWYLDTRDTEQFNLTRDSLEGLIRLYNSIHRGNPLLLKDRRSLDRLEARNRRLTEGADTRDLSIDENNRRIAPRFAACAWIRRLVRCLIRRL